MNSHRASDLCPRRIRFLSPWIAFVLSSLVCATELRAQFQTPISISDGVTSGDYAMGIDQFGIVQLAYREGGRLRVHAVGPDLDLAAELSETGSAPALAFFATGFHVAYATEHEMGACVESRTRIGGALGRPGVLASATSAVDAPALRLDSARQLVVAWQELRDGEWRVIVDGPDIDPVDLGRGEAPALEVDRFDRIHVVFVRAGSLLYSSNAGLADRSRFSPPRLTALGAGSVGSRPTIGILDGRYLYIAYERQGDLFIADNRTGDFVPRRIATGGVSDPHLQVTPGGILALTYVQDGDVWYVLGNAFLFAGPQPVARTPGDESAPRADADAFANIFVSFIRDGALWMTTDAGRPQARFRAEPMRGEAPLEVAFRDESRGDVTSWAWDFGDGTTASQANPSHVFAETGEFTVRLRVAGPGGESPLTHEETILVTAPGHWMWAGAARAFPGLAVSVPILGTHDRPAQGFQIAATFDPGVLRVEDVDLRNTNIGSLEPELRVFNISNDPDEPFVTIGVLLDIEPPFDRRMLQPGVGQRLANLDARIDAGAVPGSTTSVALRNQIGRPPINNIWIVGSRSVVPVLGDSAAVEVEALRFPPPRFFSRGDTDRSGSVTISDAIMILNYLFVGGDAPRCLDSADVNDSGTLDLTDAAYLLNFLFRAGSYIAAPYPQQGLDPTPDSLPDCTL